MHWPLFLLRENRDNSCGFEWKRMAGLTKMEQLGQASEVDRVHMPLRSTALPHL